MEVKMSLQNGIWIFSLILLLLITLILFGTSVLKLVVGLHRYYKRKKRK